MRIKGRARTGGMVLAGLLALGACGGTTVVEAGAPAPVPVSDSTPGAGQADPEAPVSSDPGATDPGVPAEDPEPEVVTPRAGMANVHEVGWEKAEVLGPKKVRIHFWGGVEPCHVLDSVKVKYGAKQVAVTLRSGSDPAKPDVACIEIAKAMAVDVVLDQALDGREIVDPTDAPADDRAPIAEAPAGKGAPTPDDGAKVVTPRPGTADPHPQSFDKAVVTGDRSVRIYFTSGVEPCTVLDSVRVAYEADRIVVTMASGRDPSVAPDTACIMLAEYRAVDVTLREDVDGRDVVDGTAV